MGLPNDQRKAMFAKRFNNAPEKLRFSILTDLRVDRPNQPDHDFNIKFKKLSKSEQDEVVHIFTILDKLKKDSDRHSNSREEELIKKKIADKGFDTSRINISVVK